MDDLTSEGDRASFGAGNCSIARTLALVGEKWTLLLLREAYYGTRRFTISGPGSGWHGTCTPPVLVQFGHKMIS